MKPVFANLSRRLTPAYLLSLSLLTLLVVGSQWTICSLHQQENRIRHAVALSERQRALSQQVTELVLLAERDTSAADRKKRIDQLSNTLQTWKQQHNALIQADASLPEPVSSLSHQPVLDQATLFCRQLFGQTKRMIASHAPVPGIDRAAVDALLQDGEKYIRCMDRLTFQYSHAASRKATAIQEVQFFGLGGSLLASLVLALVVFRPTGQEYHASVPTAPERPSDQPTDAADPTAQQQAPDAALPPEATRQEPNQLTEANHPFIRAIIETLPDILYVYDLAEGRSVFANQRVSAILGYSVEEIQAMGNQFMPQLLHPDDVPTLVDRQHWFASAKDQEVLTYEYRMKHRDGHLVWLCSQEVAFSRNAEGKVTQTLGIARDVTEKKQQLSLLTASEATYRSLVEHAQDLIYELNEDGYFTYVNAALKKVLGYSEAQFLRMRYYEVIAESHRQQVIDFYRKQVAVGMEESYLELPVKTNRGSIFWIGQNIKLELKNGWVMSVRTIARDISEIKRTTGELNELKNLLSSVLDNSPTGIMAFKSLRDTDGQLVDLEWTVANKTSERMVGKKTSQLLDHRYSETLTGTSDAPLLDLYKQVAATGEPLHHLYCYDHQGTRSWFQIVAVKMGDGLVVTLQDITEQKNIARQLEQQREFYETILNHLPSDVVVLGPDFRYLFVNPAAIASEEVRQWIVGKNDYEYCRHRNKDLALAEKRHAVFQSAVAQKRQLEWEESFVDGLGKKSYHLRRLKPLFNKEDRLQLVIGYGFNITERKMVEQELASQQSFIGQVIDTSPNRVFVQDWQGRYTLVNRVLADTYGRSAEEIIGKTHGQLTGDWEKDESILRETRELIQRAPANILSVAEVEQQLPGRPDEGMRWFQVIKKPFLAPNGSIQILGIATDITKRKETEEKLISSQRLLAESQRMAQLGSWELDMKHTGELTWSEETFRLFNLDPSERVPTFAEYLRMLHPDDAVLLSQKIGQILEDRVPYEVELRIIRPNQEVCYTLSRGKIEFEGDTPVKLVGTILDVTDRKLVEMELRKAKEEAEHSMKAKEMFLSTMSHEIRTPLNAVIGMTHLLLEENPKPDQIQHLQTLRFSAQNLLVIINDILDFSKIESGKVVFEEVDFNVVELCNGVRNSLKFRAEEKGIRFCTSLDSEIPPMLVGDPVRLAQVLTNLVSNAVKFTEQGSVELAVRLVRQAELVELEFSVSDTGIGIPDDKLADIFESFTQANSDTTRKYGGTGLGLTITKRLLELQGSQIQVTTTLGEGSRFYFTLPFRKSQKSSAGAAKHYDASLLEPFPDLQVLLVEDIVANQLIAKKFLNKWGIQPDIASNGALAVEKVQQKVYDMVLMDLQMPVMDGYQATQLIRSLPDEYYQHLPIIALTASAMGDIRNKVLAVGMTDYITKPFNPDDLYRKIAKYTSFKGEMVAETDDLPANEPPRQGYLSFAGLESLTNGDRAFRRELTAIHVRSFDEFSRDYRTALLNRDPALLSTIIHKIQPALVLLDTQELQDEIVHGRTLAISPSAELESLESSIERVNEISRQIIETLAASLETL